MTLTENWVTASIKKELDFNKEKLERYEAEGNQKMKIYYKGIVKGIEMSLVEIKNSFNQ